MVLLAALIYLPASAQTTDAPPDYVEQIQAHRDSIAADMRDPETSVLSDEDRAAFDGLVYFDIDPGYRVEATFEADDDPIRRPLSTTMGGTRPNETAGTVTFRLNGSEHELTVYRSVTVETDTLTIPFTDITTGESTYSAGRYLFITEQDIASNPVVVDFNRATNPACAYNEQYNCVIPPEENALPIAIEAGVKANSDVGTPYSRTKMIDDIENMADAEWVTVDIDDGHYRMSFPEAPKDSTWQEEGQRGTLQFSTRTVISSQISFYASHLAFPTSFEEVGMSEEEMLANLESRVTSGVSSVEVEDFTFQDYPAKKIRYTTESKEFEVLWRLYAIGGDVYQNAVQMPIYGDPAAAERFLDSFELTLPADSIAALASARTSTPPSATEGDSTTASADSAAVGPSPEINAMLEEIGWTPYDIDSYNRYVVTLRVDDERTQSGRIMVVPEDAAERPGAGYEIYSVIHESDEPLSKEFMRDLLLENGPGYGSFELYELEDGSVIVAYAVFVRKPLTAASLRSIFSHVVRTADKMEEKHVGGDDY